MNPELLRILEYARQRNIEIRIGNGANLNHVRETVLEALVKYRVGVITCSIDGASPETYRIYRKRGDFDTVIRNIEQINLFKRQYQSALPQLVWQFIIFGHNEHEIPVARAMAARLGMDFRTKLSWSTFSPIRDKDFVRQQTGQKAVTREEHEEQHGQKYFNHICYQLWDYPQINWDGKILGCGRNFWGDFGGNAFTDGLIKSINNRKIAYAREMLKGARPPRADIPCTTCELYQGMQKRSSFINDR